MDTPHQHARMAMTVRLARALASESTTFGHVTPSAPSRRVNAYFPLLTSNICSRRFTDRPKTRRPTPQVRATSTTVTHVTYVAREDQPLLGLAL